MSHDKDEDLKQRCSLAIPLLRGGKDDKFSVEQITCIYYVSGITLYRLVLFGLAVEE